MRQLEVFINDVRAGLLKEENPGRGYSFRYYPEYLNFDMPPISVNLKKQAEEYSDEILFPFFANIISEGANRRIVCRSLKIDGTDIFGILYAMADKDFIGAVNVRRIKDGN